MEKEASHFVRLHDVQVWQNWRLRLVGELWGGGNWAFGIFEQCDILEFTKKREVP
jgi:hypothetical protein